MRYRDRAQNVHNPTAKRLLELMDSKQTNLCASMDVTSATEFLRLTELVGPEICLLKTHIDTLEDFSDDFVRELLRLAGEHRFLIFEDRKFADIGNTVKLQYSKGVHHIVEWADMVNAFITPGQGIIEGLKEVGLPQGRGLLLIAELSSAGSLATGEYTKTAYRWGRQHQDFVIGYIGKGNKAIPDEMITLTPGINLETAGDRLGQQYQTPAQAIGQGTDAIIVGRGIYQADDPLAAAKRYRRAGWQAYADREGF